EERPDAHTLMEAGGVEVLDVKVSPAAGLQAGPASKTWMFVRDPADIVFYSGHGAWWTGDLVTEGPGHTYPEWVTPEELLVNWEGRMPNKHRTPWAMSALIINGCSVLFWDRQKENDPNFWPSEGLRWKKLLTPGGLQGGPLSVILGYRWKAPKDEIFGNH